jgi:fermentation-respiration switch protein FrsA (DUF1100 family)
MMSNALRWLLMPFRFRKFPFWRRSWKHRMAGYALDLVVLYVGVAALLMFLENWLLYHPSSAKEWTAPPDSLHVQDVALTAADGTQIHAWWCPPADWTPAHGAVLYCHGNAGNLSQRGDAAILWQKALGHAVLLFDYPGYGRSDGKPSEAGCYAAADAAYAWLVDVQKTPAENILILGSSLGGGVAVDLARRKQHRALVLLSTFTSIPAMAQRIYFWLPTRLLVRNRFDNLAKITQCSRPVFIAHGSADDLIPMDQSKQLFNAAIEPKQFFPIPGQGHDEFVPFEFFAVLSAFLEKHAPLK